MQRKPDHGGAGRDCQVRFPGGDASQNADTEIGAMFMHLRCSNQDCAATLDLHDRALSCPVCADLLEVVVDSVANTPAELKRMWLERRCSYAPLDASGVWRFREFLPNCYSDVVTMSEGNNLSLIHISEPTRRTPTSY